MMKTKRLGMLMGALALFCASTALAHDGGHGPQLTDTGKFGGVITGVVETKDAAKGAHAALVYKAELVRSDDQTVRVYVYDKTMKIIPGAQLGAKAEANIIALAGGKQSATPFALTLENNVFVGKMPKPAAKPYHIEVAFKLTDKHLLAAFDNLD